jgi:hypothetical protein
MNDTVVAIVSAFFIIGIAAGIIAVVAMSVLRAERRGHRDDDYADSYGPDEPPQGSGWDDTTPDGHPRWPGESDTEFRGR